MSFNGKEKNLYGETNDSDNQAPNTLSMNLPSGVSPQSVVFAANKRLKVNDRTQLVRESGFAAIASADVEGVEVGSSTVTGSIVSVGNVMLRDSATVHGMVVTSGAIAAQNLVTIDDETNSREGAELAPYERLEFRVEFPDGVTTSKILESDQVDVLLPGDYSRVVVKSRATLTLSPGVYSIHEFLIEPEATVTIDDNTGPVILKVRDRFTYKGAVKSTTANLPHWFIVFAGTETVFIEKSFAGTVFAPRASLVLASAQDGHKGSFFANNIEAHQGTLITHVSSDDWRDYCQLLPPEEMDEKSFCKRFEDAEPPSDSVETTVEMPLDTVVDEVVFGAKDSIEIGENVTIYTEDDYIPLITSADGSVDIGNGSSVGTVVSVDNVVIDGAVTLGGDLITEGEIVINNGGTVMVSGTTDDSAVLTPSDSLSYTHEFPKENSGSIILQPGREKILAEGEYDKVVAESGSVLYLRSGEYSFNSLILEEGSKLVLEEVNGKTFIYVHHEILLDGIMEALGKYNVDGNLTPYELDDERDAHPIVTYYGEGTVKIHPPFGGTFTGPNSTIELGDGNAVDYKGCFWGNRILVHDNVTVEGMKCGLSEFTDDPVDGAIQIDLLGESVRMDVSDNYQNDGSNCKTVTTPTMVEFDIPLLLRVVSGNAGNYTATLNVVADSGEQIQCTYQGGASVAHPIDSLEIAKGLEYKFVSCTGGHQPKETLEGNSFTLCINGDPQSTFGNTTDVALDLDKNCNGVMPPIISPEETVQMYNSFNWATSSELSEFNDEGYPSLYYMNIFISNERQREFLDALMIHWDTMPLFPDEMERIDNLCGTMNMGDVFMDDMQGTWVFAVVPATIYNLIREAYFSNEVKDDERIIFEKMVLRQYDAGSAEANNKLFEANGSLDYQTLVDAGFYYMGLPGLPSEAALDEMLQQEKSARKLLQSALQFIAHGVRNIVRKVTEVLGTINRWIHGSVQLSMDFNMMRMDETFDRTRPLQVGWGTRGGHELGAEGLRVQFYQWVSSPVTLKIPVLTSHNGKTNINGKASFKVAHNGFSGWVCVDYQNDAARITNHLLTDRWCHGGVGGNDLNGISDDTDLTIRTHNDNFLIMAETMNGWRYARDVIGYEADRANVMRGPIAYLLTFFDKEGANALSLSQVNFFNSDLLAAIDLITLFSGGLVKLYPSEIVRQVDINIANDALHGDGGRNMGLVTHEYGHYITFNMLSDLGGESQWFHDRLLLRYLGEVAGEVEEDDDVVIVAESLADFFASQVVSGANYFCFGDQNTKHNGPNGDYHLMAFCRRDASLASIEPCADTNLRDHTDSECSEEAHENIQRMVVEMLHDSVDNINAAKQSLQPTGADAWLESGGGPGRLAYTPVSWGNINDEDVAIGGAGFKQFIETLSHTEAENNNGIVDVESLKSALAVTLREPIPADRQAVLLNKSNPSYNGKYTWCDACDLFVLHEGGSSNFTLDNNTGGRYEDARWALCTNRPALQELIGDPPHPELRMNTDCQVCPPRHFAQVDGTGRHICTQCTGSNEIVVGNTCDDCPSDHYPDGDTCVPCPSNMHFDIAAGKCVPCPDGMGWNLVTETCDACPTDKHVYITAGGPIEDHCTRMKIKALDNQVPGDVCPDELWVELHDLDVLLQDSGSFPQVIRHAWSGGEHSNWGPEYCEVSESQTTLYTLPVGSTTWTEFKSITEGDGNWVEPRNGTEYCALNDTGGDSPMDLTRTDVQGGIHSAKFRSRCDYVGMTDACEMDLAISSTCFVE